MIVQTPGVYITENNTLPNSIAGVSTAVPVFIGVTQIAQPDPIRISSFFEFQQAFGKSYSSQFDVDTATNEIVADKRFFLSDTVDLYFKNGGGPCYIISAGDFTSTDNTNIVGQLTTALTQVDGLDEVTLVSIPDMHFQFKDNGSQSSLSGASDYASLANELINKCAVLKDKFALLDYHESTTDTADIRQWISPFSDSLKYGAVYYPWLVQSSKVVLSADQLTLSATTGSAAETALSTLNTDVSGLETAYGTLYTLVRLRNEWNSLTADVSTKSNLTDAIRFLYELIQPLDTTITLNDPILDQFRTGLSNNVAFITAVKNLYWMVTTVGSGASGLLSANFPAAAIQPSDSWINQTYPQYADYTALTSDHATLNYTAPALGTAQDNYEAFMADVKSGQWVDVNSIFTAIAGLFDKVTYRKQQLEEQLFATDLTYGNARTAITNYLKNIPAQGVVAGAYCKNDRDRGVWKSPANITIQGIEKPFVEVSNAEQDLLNVDSTTGKSINVIRTFTGKGALIWGARTLEGNSNEWRYIAVRRFYNYAEESIKKAMNNFVFEPNNARTWVKIKATIISFLMDQWKSGALVGVKPEEAFFVKIGEETTTDSEILAGKINVEIGMAVARPAEFIIISFSHYSKS